MTYTTDFTYLVDIYISLTFLNITDISINQSYIFFNQIILPTISYSLENKLDNLILLGLILLSCRTLKEKRGLGVASKVLSTGASGTDINQTATSSENNNKVKFDDKNKEKNKENKQTNDTNTTNDHSKDNYKSTNYSTKMNNNIRQSFFFTFIMSNLNIDASQLDTSITQFSYAIFTLSLIALLSFINILGYILAYYIYKQVDYETKYPKLSK